MPFTVGGEASRQEGLLFGIYSVCSDIKISRCFEMLSRQLHTQFWSPMVKVGCTNSAVVNIKIDGINAIGVLGPGAGDQQKRILLFLVLTFQ